MALTDKEIKTIAPKSKDFFVSDEKGLRLLVKKNGAKYWRFNYRFRGKQKTLALGVYPETSLKRARVERDRARIDISEGIDPSKARREERRHFNSEGARLFSELAKLWWEHSKGTWSKDHAARVWTRLSDNSFKHLDKKPIDEIVPKDVREVIRLIETRGALDVASRVLQDIRRTFSYGIHEEWVKFNPAADMSKDILQGRKTNHRASMRNNELGLFLVDVGGYHKKGRLLTQYAIQLLVHTFLRPGELRGAEWREFDLEEKLWRIPASRMKMNTDHIVPLSHQAIQIIEKIRPITGRYELVFPSEKSRFKPMSDNTMRRAMFKLGYDGSIEGRSKATPHGFGANASSILNEKGFNADAIERQLSHMPRDDVRAAYTYYAQYLDERVKIMQWWADYLEEQRNRVLLGM